MNENEDLERGADRHLRDSSSDGGGQDAPLVDSPQGARVETHPRHPCRLAVFQALESPVAAVLRRGPTRWAHLSLWDRRTDTVQPGQWFRGRIYARRCDLSPRGDLFVYFAARHGRSDGNVTEAWTALSRPPWLTALCLWENIGSWYGGGAFTPSGDLRLDATCSLEVHPDFKPPPMEIRHIGADAAPWEARLVAHGWSLEERGFHPRTHQRIGEREVWSKAGRGTGTVLFQQVEDWDPNRYGSPYWSTYWLETDDDLIPLDGVEWADWDGTRDEARPRLVFTRGGQLLELGGSNLEGSPEVIYDFNPLTPDPAPAPDSALQWPGRRGS